MSLSAKLEESKAAHRQCFDHFQVVSIENEGLKGEKKELLRQLAEYHELYALLKKSMHIVLSRNEQLEANGRR